MWGGTPLRWDCQKGQGKDQGMTSAAGSLQQQRTIHPVLGSTVPWSQWLHECSCNSPYSILPQPAVPGWLSTGAFPGLAEHLETRRSSCHRVVLSLWFAALHGPRVMPTEYSSSADQLSLVLLTIIQIPKHMAFCKMSSEQGWRYPLSSPLLALPWLY